MRKACHHNSALRNQALPKRSALAIERRTGDRPSSRSGVRHPSSGVCLQSAFTLIELVVTMVIMGIIALVTIDYLINASRVYTLLLAQRQADSDTMAVVKRMRREARVWQANITNTNTEWRFFTRPGYTNSFKWSGGTMLLNSNTLAKNVQTFHLDYYNATNGITTNLALIRRVALKLRVTNNLAASELQVNFFLREGLLK